MAGEEAVRHLLVVAAAVLAAVAAVAPQAVVAALAMAAMAAMAATRCAAAHKPWGRPCLPQRRA